MEDYQFEQAKAYTPEYFLGLDPELSLEAAQGLADSWNRTNAQTLEEVRAGRRWEEEQRLASANKTWVSEVKKQESK